MPRKKKSDFVDEITAKNSKFMKRFGNLKNLKKVHGNELFKTLGFYNNNSDDFWGYDYHYSFRGVFEGAGFIVEPAYPHEMYPYYNSHRDYYIAKSPYQKVRTRSTLQLHLILRAFMVSFLKQSRSQSSLDRFIDELKENSKIQEIDVFRLKSFGKIYLKNEELRLGTFYEVVARNLVSKKIRKGLPKTVINTIKDEKNYLDKKAFKNVLLFFNRLKIMEAAELLSGLDFIVVDKNKKYSFTGESLDLESLVPYNPYIDKNGNLKINKKSARKLKKNTSKAQKILRKHIKADENEVRSSPQKDTPQRLKLKFDLNIHLSNLIKKQHWTDKEIEEYAQKSGYMKMKLILEINQYCEEHFDDFLLLESGNGFKINEYILRGINDGKKNTAS